jgi:outer membrane cobalamin receptor
VITAEQIAQWNALDAFEVLERVGGYSLAETRNGGVAIRQRRGQSSITNTSADRPLLLLDNTLLSSASVLRQVRASQIDRVELLPAGAATARYGTGGAAGAILIFTRTR